MPRTPEEMHAAIIRGLKEKTGKSLEEWLAVVRTREGAPRRERIEWLQAEYGLGGSTASRIVVEADRPAGYTPPTPETLVDGQYSGPKAALRPLYERLMAGVLDLCPETLLEPRQTYTSLSRTAGKRVKQFAVIQPSTKTRVDVGLILQEAPETERLRPAGSFGPGGTTHRVGLSFPSDVDDELLGWIKAAYEGVAEKG